MVQRVQPLERLTTGFRRGICEWRVEDLSSLQQHDIVESNTFDIGGFKWKLGLCRRLRNGCGPQLVKIFFFSCNAQGIRADVNLTQHEENQSGSCPFERKPKVASPFRYIDKLEIPFKKLMDTHQSPQVPLKVMADLKNVREATRDELRASTINMRTVHVEVITDESIRQVRNEGGLFRIVPPTKKRHADVMSHSFVRQWARQSPDHRYWLCERSKGGGLAVKRCLNQAGMFECFENICDDSGGGYPWVTVFREDKESHESFQPVNDDTILTFCLFCEKPFEDHSYAGILLVPKSMSCQELLTKVANDWDCIGQHAEFRAYLQRGRFCAEITFNQSSLAESGVQSGSFVVFELQPSAKHVPDRSISESDGSDDRNKADTDHQSSTCVTSQEKCMILCRTAKIKPWQTIRFEYKNTRPRATTSESRAEFEHCLQASGHDLYNDASRDQFIEMTRIKSRNMYGSQSVCESSTRDQNIQTERYPGIAVQVYQNGTKAEHISPSSSAQISALKSANQFTGISDVKTTDICVKADPQVEKAFREIGAQMVTTLYRGVTEPIIKALKQVSEAVNGVRKVVDARCHEVCKANMLANIEIEQLSCNGVTLHLRDRDAHKVPMIADDFARENPIFLLNRHHQHRLRVSLAHKHQGDATNFKIKHISIKPSDGLELGLTISDAKPPSEGSEVVALLPLDSFQSSRLSSGCPQFESVEEKYVSLATTIGIATAAYDSSGDQNSTFELKGQVLCLPVSRPDMAGFKSFQRFASQSWRSSPQWIRDGARGAVILTSMAIVKSGPVSLMSPVSSLEIQDENETQVDQIDQSVELKDNASTIIDRQTVKTLEAATNEIRQILIENIRTELQGPIVKAIKEVGGSVNDVRDTVNRTYQEMSKANLMANIELEQLTREDLHLHLRDREGRKVMTMRDDYVRDEPVFVMHRQSAHRLRVSLAHRHQWDAARFKIRYVAAQASDGLELGLLVSECRPSLEGSEVVCYFPCDRFQSVRLSSGCPQFGTVEERYVSVSVTIGIEKASVPLSKREPIIELKGRILCLPVDASGSERTQEFRRFSGDTWQQAPQWIRDQARGAVILTSMAIGGSAKSVEKRGYGPWGNLIAMLFILPCFRCNDRQLIE